MPLQSYPLLPLKVSIPGGLMTPNEKDFLVAALADMNCLPVFLEADIARAAYHGYCKQVRRRGVRALTHYDHRRC